MKYLLLFLLLSPVQLYAQANGQPSFPEGCAKHRLPLKDSTGLYAEAGAGPVLFYAAQKPAGKAKGVLVLFPPTGQAVSDVMAANRELMTLAHDSGLLVIVPSINHNLYLDKAALHFLNTVFLDVLKRYEPARNKFTFGGFSLGGMNAIRYAELSAADSSLTAVRPAAVYGIDPPLDWGRMYHSFQRTVQKNFSVPAVNEARYYLDRLNGEFGGPPEANPAAYMEHSMYTKTAPGGGNARYLRNMPIRIYADPDINWQLANRQADFYDMNVLDGAAMINQLHIDGNSKAELVVALGKGYRPDGTRHPHSWSLAAPADCIQWLLHCLQ